MTEEHPLKIVRPEAFSGNSEAKKTLESALELADKIKARGALVLLMNQNEGLTYIRGFDVGTNTVIGAIERIKIQLIMEVDGND